jgi:hypothetical protein
LTADGVRDSSAHSSIRQIGSSMCAESSRAIRLLAEYVSSGAACRPEGASTGASRTTTPRCSASSGTVSTSRPNEQVSQSRWKVSACTTTAARGQSAAGPQTVSMMISVSRPASSKRPMPKYASGDSR